MTAVSACERVEFDLASVVREHQADLWRYLRYLGATAEDADDLAQETFLAVARTPFEQRSRHETAAYLRTAARNQLLMLRRRQGRQVSTVELAAAEQVWAEATDGGPVSELLELLSRCYEALSGRAREAVDRFYREGDSREQLAARLEISVDGVKTLLRRTRTVLRECMERRVRMKAPVE
ncbi:MAG: RNA polymerase sigma factor [Pirellulales bacterium]|nr:RNA polymerase sigma factor [Pirellulales bacterium]